MRKRNAGGEMREAHAMSHCRNTKAMPGASAFDMMDDKGRRRRVKSTKPAWSVGLGFEMIAPVLGASANPPHLRLSSRLLLWEDGDECGVLALWPEDAR